MRKTSSPFIPDDELLVTRYTFASHQSGTIVALQKLYKPQTVYAKYTGCVSVALACLAQHIVAMPNLSHIVIYTAIT